MSFKHTPGPWVAIPATDPEITNVQIHSYSTPSLWLASVHGSHVDTSDDQMGANAKLIAAAPEMFDALRNGLLLLEKIMNEAPVHSERFRELHKCVGGMQQAIHKAY